MACVFEHSVRTVQALVSAAAATAAAENPLKMRICAVAVCYGLPILLLCWKKINIVWEMRVIKRSNGTNEHHTICSLSVTIPLTYAIKHIHTYRRTHSIHSRKRAKKIERIHTQQITSLVYLFFDYAKLSSRSGCLHPCSHDSDLYIY